MNNAKKLGTFILLICLFFSISFFVPFTGAVEINPLSAKFKEIRNTQLGSYGIFTITNTGQHDIDDVTLSLSLKDSKGKTLSSMGVTDSTVGVVWLKAGQSKEEGVPLDRSREAQLLLENNPNEANLEIKIKSMSFMNNQMKSSTQN